MDEKLLNRIISVAYGDASLWEKIKIHQLANKNSEIKSLLDEYTKVANTAHDLKLEDCPVEILNEIKEVTSSKEHRENSLLYDIYSFVFRRPAISGAILTVVIVALVSTFIIKRPEIHQHYSKHEIEQADLQVKHSLALIAEVFKKTSLTVEKDVLTNRVSKPIKESFNLVNDYLQGENNESIN